MIRGEKILLRTVREADLDQYYDLSSDISNRGAYFSLEIQSQVDFKNRFREHGFMEDTKGTFLICAADQIVGAISFFPASYYNGLEFGYILFDEASRGKGYMTEAVSLLVKHLFATKKINRLQIAAVPDNIASKRVAEKCGFQFEGIIREAAFMHGKNHDIALYSLLRSEADRV